MTQQKKNTRTVAYARTAYPSERSVARADYDRKPITGPWISRENIPDMLRDFDQNRDPQIAKQLDEQYLSEKERRDRTDTGAYKIERGQAKPVLKPRSAQGPQPNQNDINGTWLQGYHQQAMQQAAINQNTKSPTKDLQPHNKPKRPTQSR